MFLAKARSDNPSPDCLEPLPRVIRLQNKVRIHLRTHFNKASLDLHKIMKLLVIIF